MTTTSDMIEHLRAVSAGLPDPRTGRRSYSLSDIVMSAFAPFYMQDGSFLAFQRKFADSDEAGHAFQNEAGHLYRSEAGRGSDLKPATQRIRPRIEAMMFRRGGLVKRAWVSGLRGRRRMGGL